MPDYSGQPADAAAKRQEILQRMQDQLVGALRGIGAVNGSAGVTRPLPSPSSSNDVLANVQQQFVKAAMSLGPNAMDANNFDASTGYRQYRYDTVSGLEGVQDRPTADGKVGVGFDMKAPNARETFDMALGGSVSFDDLSKGVVSLTPAQSRALFDYQMVETEKRVDAATSGRALSQQQRIALIAGERATPGTLDHVSPYVKSGNDAAVVSSLLHPDELPAKGSSTSRRFGAATLYTGHSNAADGALPDFRSYRDTATQVKGDFGAPTAFLTSRLTDGHGAGSVLGLTQRTQERLTTLFQAAPPEIANGLGVYSGYRDVKEQQVLWDAALRKYGSAEAARKWVAPPGQSNHNAGEAVDLAYNGESLAHAPANVVAWLHANAPQYGLHFPLPNENWHIEPIK